MGMNDTMADFLTRVRNACRAGHENVLVPYSVATEKVARILTNEGYLEDVQVVGEGLKKAVSIRLKYVGGENAITGIARTSKSSRRVYTGYRDIKPVMSGFGLSILTTPAGIMSDADAKKKRVGGEVICTVW